MRSISADLNSTQARGQGDFNFRQNRFAGLQRRAGLVSGATLAFTDVAAFGLAIAIFVKPAWLAGFVPDLHIAGDLSADSRVPLLCQALSFLGVLGYFLFTGHYRERLPFWTETRQVAVASIVALLAGSFLETLAGRTTPVVLVSIWAAFLVLAIFLRATAKHLLDSAGFWQMPVILVGEGPSILNLVDALFSGRTAGYRMAAELTPGGLSDLLARREGAALLRRFGARRFIVAIDTHLQTDRNILRALVRARLPFMVATHIDGLPMVSGRSIPLASHDTLMISYRGHASNSLQRGLKILLDVSLAGTALLVLAPLMLIIAFLIRRDGGPALFAHTRIGAGGKPFSCLKFRSMVTDSKRVLQELLATNPAAAAEWAATQKLSNDPRVTPVGRFLRKTSLDELPQLINVLRLEMSLVGPRPIVEAEVERYADDIAFYYATRPGLTGLWQISGRSDTSYENRVKLDSRYVRNWHFLHDVAILVKTLPAVLSARGAR